MKIKLFSFVLFISIVLTSPVYAQWVSVGPDSGETSTSLSFDNSSGYLFLGTAEGFWYYNPSNSLWTRREDVGWIGRSVFAVAAHPTIPGRILTGRMNGFFKGYLEYTNDWGVTNEIGYFSNGGNVTDIKNIPGSPNTFFACTWPDIAPGELVKSTDGGINWVLQSNYHHYALTEIAVDQSNPSIIYISGDEGVTKSTNGGATWSISSTGLPSGLGVYAVSVSGQILLASNDNGIYRSTNSGGNWTQVFSSVPQHFEFNPVNPAYVAAVTFSPYKILLSSDAGLTWSDFTGNYAGDEVSDLAFNTDGTKLYVSSRMDGVFIHDFSFVPVELVSFTAMMNAGDVILQWETVSELNNDGFEIERSVNSEWQRIGFVKGNGTTTEKNKYTFTDLNPGEGNYSYRLKQVNTDGTYEYSQVIEIEVNHPEQFALLQNYPNPFNPSTTISFILPSESNVKISVYNVTGEVVTTLINSTLQSGTHEASFNTGEINLSSGIYFYSIEAYATDGSGSFKQTRKMVLSK
jgi:hypothetical protein